ncbi:hypothetical protein HHI36_010004 [Cryptolaemus montrouzieri]|uniref:Uncharacterized protein n=1 Tax=Cryptolaemus montrouzieri TaxID=559131 RepID=A0ABD2MHF0_9CUCU
MEGKPRGATEYNSSQKENRTDRSFSIVLAKEESDLSEQPQVTTPHTSDENVVAGRNTAEASSVPSSDLPLTCPQIEPVPIISGRETIPSDQSSTSRKKLLSSPKRCIDETLSPPIVSEKEDGSEIFMQPKTLIQIAKKKKNQTDNPSKNKLKDFITTHEPSFILDYNQISDLLQNIKGSSDPISITQNYTENYAALIDMLTKIYSLDKERYTKTKITKLRKTLMEHLDIQMHQDLSFHNNLAMLLIILSEQKP